MTGLLHTFRALFFRLTNVSPDFTPLPTFPDRKASQSETARPIAGSSAP